MAGKIDVGGVVICCIESDARLTPDDDHVDHVSLACRTAAGINTSISTHRAADRV
ncbi:MAG: hypothetical protein AB7O77_15875 [Phycisphaerales bacterium]